MREESAEVTKYREWAKAHKDQQETKSQKDRAAEFGISQAWAGKINKEFGITPKGRTKSGQSEVSEDATRKASTGTVEYQPAYTKIGEDVFVLPNIIARAVAILDELARMYKNDLSSLQRALDNPDEMKKVMQEEPGMAMAFKTKGRLEVKDTVVLLARIIQEIADNSPDKVFTEADQAVLDLLRDQREEFIKLLTAQQSTFPRVDIHSFPAGNEQLPNKERVRELVERVLIHERLHNFVPVEDRFSNYSAMQQIKSAFINDPEFEEFYGEFIRVYPYGGTLMGAEEFFVQLYIPSDPDRTVQEKTARLRERIRERFVAHGELGRYVLDIIEKIDSFAEAAEEMGRADVKAMDQAGLITDEGLALSQASSTIAEQMWQEAQKPGTLDRWKTKTQAQIGQEFGGVSQVTIGRSIKIIKEVHKLAIETVGPSGREVTIPTLLLREVAKSQDVRVEWDTMTLQEIGDIFGLSASTVYNELSPLGIKTKGVGGPQETAKTKKLRTAVQNAETRKRWETMSQQEIAIERGVSQSTVSNVFGGDVTTFGKIVKGRDREKAAQLRAASAGTVQERTATYIRIENNLFVVPRIIEKILEMNAKLFQIYAGDWQAMKAAVNDPGVMMRLDQLNPPLAASNKALPTDAHRQQAAETATRVAQWVIQNSQSRPYSPEDDAVVELLIKDQPEFTRSIKKFFESANITIYPFLAKDGEKEEAGTEKVSEVVEYFLSHERLHSLFSENEILEYHTVMREIKKEFGTDPAFMEFYDNFKERYPHVEGNFDSEIRATEEFWMQLYYNTKFEDGVLTRTRRLREAIHTRFVDLKDGPILALFDQMQDRARSASRLGEIDAINLLQAGIIQDKGLVFIQAASVGAMEGASSAIIDSLLAKARSILIPAMFAFATPPLVNAAIFDSQILPHGAPNDTVVVQQGDTPESIARRYIELQQVLKISDLRRFISSPEEVFKKLQEKGFINSQGEVQEGFSNNNDYQKFRSIMGDQENLIEVYEMMRIIQKGKIEFTDGEVDQIAEAVRSAIPQAGDAPQPRSININSVKELIQTIQSLRVLDIVGSHTVKTDQGNINMYFAYFPEGYMNKSDAFVVGKNIFLNLGVQIKMVEDIRSFLAKKLDHPLGELYQRAYGNLSDEDILKSAGRTILAHEWGHTLTDEQIDSGAVRLFGEPVSFENFMVTKEVSGLLAEVGGSDFPQISLTILLTSHENRKYSAAAQRIAQEILPKLGALDYFSKEIQRNPRYRQSRLLTESDFSDTGISNVAQLMQSLQTAGYVSNNGVVINVPQGPDDLKLPVYTATEKLEIFRVLFRAAIPHFEELMTKFVAQAPSDKIDAAVRDMHEKVFKVKLPPKGHVDYPPEIIKQMLDKYREMQQKSKEQLGEKKALGFSLAGSISSSAVAEFGAVERKIPEILGKVLDEDGIDPESDLSLISAGRLNAVMEEFLDRFMQGNDKTLPVYARMVNQLMTPQELRNHRTHYNAFDLASALQKIHSLSTQLSLFGIREELLGNTFSLAALLHQMPYSYALLLDIGESAALAGPDWDRVQPHAQVLDAVRKGDLRTALGHMIPGGTIRDNWPQLKAIATVFDIDILDMERMLLVESTQSLTQAIENPATRGQVVDVIGKKMGAAFMKDALLPLGAVNSLNNKGRNLRIKKLLGQGKDGIVLEVEDAKNEAFVLKTNRAKSPAETQLFIRNMQKIDARTKGNPAFVQNRGMFSFNMGSQDAAGNVTTSTFIVEENDLVDGESMRTVLSADLEGIRLFELADQFFRMHEFLNSTGSVNLDSVNLENILVNKEGIAVLVDRANLIDRQDLAKLVHDRDGQPEQEVLAEIDQDTKSNIARAITRMLTGQTINVIDEGILPFVSSLMESRLPANSMPAAMHLMETLARTVNDENVDLAEFFEMTDQAMKPLRGSSTVLAQAQPDITVKERALAALQYIRSKPNIFSDPMTVDRVLLKFAQIEEKINSGEIIVDEKGYLRFNDVQRRGLLPDYWYQGTKHNRNFARDILFGKNAGALTLGNLTRNKDYAESYRGDGLVIAFDFSQDRLAAVKHFDHPFDPSVNITTPIPIFMLTPESKMAILGRLSNLTETQMQTAANLLGLSLDSVKEFYRSGAAGSTILSESQGKQKDKLGGIDMNQRALDLQIEGDSIHFDRPIDLEFEDLPFDGFSPVILQILPTNLPLFISTTTPTVEMQVTSSR